MTKPYETSWFEQDVKPLWEKEILPRRHGIDTYLEIGIGGGYSAEWVLENLDVNKAFLVDPWLKVSARHDQDSYDAAQVAAMGRLQPYIDGGRAQLYLYKMTSRDFFGAKFFEDCENELNHWDIPDGTIDMAYVDGSHAGTDALFDMVNCYFKLRPQQRLKEEPEDKSDPWLIKGSSGKKNTWYRRGGLMVIDDQNRVHHHQRAETRLATYGYLVGLTGYYQVLVWTQRQLILTKV